MSPTRCRATAHLLASAITLTLLAATAAHAQNGNTTSPAPSLHPWQVPPPRLSAEAYFSNLKDGDRITTPYLVKFGLSGGWGLAPIAKAGQGKSGHHHLLVNRDLPLNFKQALPFNDQYIHFGKGQMETVLNLPPGEYNLRMLLADQQHLPHFVYSKPTKIVVTGKNNSDPKTLQKKGLELGLDAPASRPPVRVRFHASLLNVAQRSQQLADTGHFRLTVTPEAGGAPAVMDFVDGETEVWLAPPAGRYSLKLEMVDNLDGSKAMAEAVTSRMEVR